MGVAEGLGGVAEGLGDHRGSSGGMLLKGQVQRPLRRSIQPLPFSTWPLYDFSLRGCNDELIQSKNL